MYRTKRKRVEENSSTTKFNGQAREFYVGTKKWSIVEKQSATKDILKYIQYCFSVIYGLMTTKSCISIDDYPYEIILQFMCAIMKYNHTYYTFMSRKNTNCSREDRNVIRYKVVKDCDLYLAECVRYEPTSGLFYFNERLVKLCLSFSNQNVQIEFSQELEEKSIDFEYHSTQQDTVELDYSILPQMCMLFMIAEHAVLHLNESEPDYINHNKMKESNLFTVHTRVKIKKVGNITDILRKFKGDTDHILTL